MRARSNTQRTCSGVVGVALKCSGMALYTSRLNRATELRLTSACGSVTMTWLTILSLMERDTGMATDSQYTRSKLVSSPLRNFR